MRVHAHRGLIWVRVPDKWPMLMLRGKPLGWPNLRELWILWSLRRGDRCNSSSTTIAARSKANLGDLTEGVAPSLIGVLGFCDSQNSIIDMGCYIPININIFAAFNIYDSRWRWYHKVFGNGHFRVAGTTRFFKECSIRNNVSRGILWIISLDNWCSCRGVTKTCASTFGAKLLSFLLWLLSNVWILPFLYCSFGNLGFLH